MLPRLRHYAVICGYDEDNQINPRCPRYHIFYETFVSRDVYYADLLSVLERKWCESDINGQPPLLLLRQAVGVYAREHSYERRLPVVDMPRRADDYVIDGLFRHLVDFKITDCRLQG